MDPQQLTMKSRQALEAAHSQALARNHQDITTEHVLAAVLGDPEGVVFPLLHHLGVTPVRLRGRVDQALEQLPKVFSGSQADVRFAPQTSRMLAAAASEAEQLTDEYVSTEHLLLAMLGEHGGGAGRLLQEAGITRDAALEALAARETALSEASGG